METENNRFTLRLLAWPIFIELFLQFLLGTADTLMVSRVSDDAVAVVGFSNNLFNALTTLFMTVSSGAGILIAQKIGAGNRGDARTIAVIALKLSVAIGLALSVWLYMAPEMIAGWLQLPAQLNPLAKTYISIVGGGMILTAVMTTLSTLIRNTGNTRGPMVTAFGMNIVHLFMNSGFIFGLFGFPQWGLTGVAVSTVVSRLLATALLSVMFMKTFNPSIGWKDTKLFDGALLKEILRLAWPLGVNMSAWFFSQLVISSFIAILGAVELSARTYMNTLESFCFLLGYALALAVQIQIAHNYGAGRTQEAYRNAYRAMYFGLGLVLANALLLLFFGIQVLQWFTTDAHILLLCVPLLWLNLLLQPAKMLNMAMISALNAVGDTRYPMMVALISMWTVAVGVSYLLGVHLGYGLIGIYVCMISDELIRGVAVLTRWRGKKYLGRTEQTQRRMQSRSV